MIKKITSVLLVIVSVLALVFRGKAASAKADLEQERRERSDAAREYEQAGSKAMVSGLEKEQEVEHETVDASRRDYFE